MSLHDLITPDSINSSLRARSRIQAFKEMAGVAAKLSGLPCQRIFEAVMEREELGATDVGGGIAIPHGKLAEARNIFAVFARFEKPVDFEARDGVPVDVVCLLIAPESSGADHLKALSRVARVLHDPLRMARLRSVSDAAALYLLLTQAAGARAA